MTVYSEYSTDEQLLLRKSLQAAAVAVSAASLGRKEETASEGFAAAEYILESRPAYVGNPLVSSVILALEARVKAEQPFPDYVEASSAPLALEEALQTLREVVVLLDQRATPEEATGYKQWLNGIAAVVAAAGKEDQGFLGRGGTQVNDAEREVLGQVSAALGLAPG